MGVHATVTGQGNGTFEVDGDPGAKWHQISVQGEDAAITAGSLAVEGWPPGQVGYDTCVANSPMNLSAGETRVQVIEVGPMRKFRMTLSALAGATTVRVVVTSGG